MTSIDPIIKDKISRVFIKDLEKKHGMTVLFAIESGSRAWGFPSKNSDYDIRFVYYKPVDHYLSLSTDKRDTIEEMIVSDQDNTIYDFSGWDIRKAYTLAAKSNPTILEWLMSPIRYTTGTLPEMFQRMTLDYMQKNFSIESMMYHHLSLVKRTYLGYFGDERKPEVSEKKYLYAVRSLLAAEYLHIHKKIPPITIYELLDGVPTGPAFRESLNSLIARKADGIESDTAPRIPELEKFIVSKLRALNDLILEPNHEERKRKELEALSHFDKSVIYYLRLSEQEPTSEQ